MHAVPSHCDMIAKIHLVVLYAHQLKIGSVSYNPLHLNFQLLQSYLLQFREISKES